MNTTPPNSVIVVLLLIALIAAVAWLKLRSLRLNRRLGPKYDLTVSEFHSRTEMQTELLNMRSASPD
jgi:hypothetical protein